MSKVLGVCTPWECSLQGGGLHLTHLPAQRSLCNERPVQLCTAPCWHPRLRRCSLKPTASNVYSAEVPWLDVPSVAASPVVVWLELKPLEELCPEAAEPAWCSYCRRGRELEDQRDGQSLQTLEGPASPVSFSREREPTWASSPFQTAVLGHLGLSPFPL